MFREVGTGENSDLLRLGEAVFMFVIVPVPIARVGFVLSTDRRTMFVDRAPVVGAEGVAYAVDLQVPVAVLDPDFAILVQQEPPKVFEIAPCRRCIDVQCEISTAQGVAPRA